MSGAETFSSGPLTATVYSEDADLAALRAEWLQLSEQSPELTPWQQWDFAAAWWPTVGAHPQGSVRRELRLIVVRDARAALLLLPLQLSRRGRFGMRWLEPLGMPDDIHRPRLALGAPNPQAYACALRAIDARRGEWDGLRIDEKSAGDAELALLAPLIRTLGWRERRAPLHPCPYLAIDRSWSEYFAGRSHKLRKNLNSGRRKLQAQGELRLRCYRSLQEIQEAVELLEGITARSWKAEARIGLGASERYRDYFRDFAARMARSGCARAYGLFVGERPVAATLAFIRGRTYYSTQIAHDREFDACSPGTILESLEMQALHEERAFEVFDFLGAALANKRRWTDTMHDTQRILWLGNSLPARAFDGLYFALKPRLAAWRARLDPPPAPPMPSR